MSEKMRQTEGTATRSYSGVREGFLATGWWVTMIAATITRPIPISPSDHLQSTSPFKLAQIPLKGLYISPVILNRKLIFIDE